MLLKFLLLYVCRFNAAVLCVLVKYPNVNIGNNHAHDVLCCNNGNALFSVSPKPS